MIDDDAFTYLLAVQYETVVLVRCFSALSFVMFVVFCAAWLVDGLQQFVAFRFSAFSCFADVRPLLKSCVFAQPVGTTAVLPGLHKPAYNQRVRPRSAVSCRHRREAARGLCANKQTIHPAAGGRGPRRTKKGQWTAGWGEEWKARIGALGIRMQRQQNEQRKSEEEKEGLQSMSPSLSHGLSKIYYRLQSPVTVQLWIY